MKKDEQLDLALPKHYLAEAEKRGEYTGERLAERKPEIYRACVSLLAQGASQLSIARLLKISVNSVAGVKNREQISIESEKRTLSNAFRLASGLAADRAIELLSDDERSKEIPLNQLAIATGIFTEKAELLSGGATSRVDWVQPAPAVDDFNQYLDDLRRTAEPIEVESGESCPEGEKGELPADRHPDRAVQIGFTPENKKTKGEPSELDQVAQVVEPDRDDQSPV